jgi:hypothetical protein
MQSRSEQYGLAFRIGIERHYLDTWLSYRAESAEVVGTMTFLPHLSSSATDSKATFRNFPLHHPVCCVLAMAVTESYRHPTTSEATLAAASASWRAFLSAAFAAFSASLAAFFKAFFDGCALFGQHQLMQCRAEIMSYPSCACSADMVFSVR